MKVSPDAVYRRIDSEGVLINLQTERMFRLNETGARFWELLASEATIADVMAKLQEEYAVSERELETEIAALLQALREEGLVDAGE